MYYQDEYVMKYQVGDICEIVGNVHRHRFAIGEHVRILEVKEGSGYYKAGKLDGSGYWYVLDEELELVETEPVKNKVDSIKQYFLETYGVEANIHITIHNTQQNENYNGELAQKIVNDLKAEVTKDHNFIDLGIKGLTTRVRVVSFDSSDYDLSAYYTEKEEVELEHSTMHK